MGKALTHLSFEDWSRHIFDHPVPISMPAWYDNPDSDYADLGRLRLVDYATRLFTDAGRLLSTYSDAQANQGLFLLAGTGGPLRILADDSIPVEPRVRCIQSISLLFEQCFRPRCTPHLSQSSEPESGLGELNAVCYMWWDMLPICGEPENPERSMIDNACLLAMEQTLGLPSVACQESALHGLGHWGFWYKERCGSIISAFLERSVNLRPELVKYALLAKKCIVQ